MLHGGLATTPLGSAIQAAKPQGCGIGARVPPSLPLEAIAPGREAQRRRPGPGSPSGRGTPDRVLGAGPRVRIRGSGGSRAAPSPLRPSAWFPRRSLRPAPAHSPRVSSGAFSTSSCEGSVSTRVLTLSSRPPGSPHLARPPLMTPPERTFPRLQLHPHVPQPLHGARLPDGLGAPRPVNLPPRGRLRPLANGGAQRGRRRGVAAAAWPGQPISGAWRDIQLGAKRHRGARRPWAGRDGRRGGAVGGGGGCGGRRPLGECGPLAGD